MEEIVYGQLVQKQSIHSLLWQLSAISEENAAASKEIAASTAELNERVKQIIREAVRLKKLSIELKKQIGIFQMT